MENEGLRRFKYIYILLVYIYILYICVYIYSYRMLYRDLYYVGLSHSILLGQDCHFDIYGGTVSPRMFAALRHSPQKVAKDFLCA